MKSSIKVPVSLTFASPLLTNLTPTQHHTVKSGILRLRAAGVDGKGKYLRPPAESEAGAMAPPSILRRSASARSSSVQALILSRVLLLGEQEQCRRICCSVVFATVLPTTGYC
eukprot:192172-Rhodomonas_salina.1